MSWNRFRGKWYNLSEANEDVKNEIEASGIRYDAKLNHYVDADGNTIPDERIAQIRREMMAERGYRFG